MNSFLISVPDLEHLKALVDIVAKETGALVMVDPDDDSVGWTEAGPLPMTFGHVRRAHSALLAVEPTPSVAVKALDADDVIDDLAALPCETHGVEDLEVGCCRTCRARSIRSALSAQVQDVATHRHKKRGSEYVLIGVGKMQAEDWFDWPDKTVAMEAVDMREVAIYRSIDDDSMWVRPVEEFNDGRFETLPAAPAKQEG